jgi:hypothetical protein
METPEKYHEYDPTVKWKKIKCPRCSKPRWNCQHHVDRKKNSNRCAWVCSNGNPEGIVYEDACHQWIHSYPDEAEKEGYYNKLDSKYMKKPSKKDKWTIVKKHSSPDKWKLNK